MGMNEIVFNDFVKLNRGFDLPNDKIVEGGYPVVASTNIKGYHNEFKVHPPCVVTGRSGSLGKVQYISCKCWPLNTALYVKDYKGNYPNYVYYFLQIMHLENYNSGAGVPTLNQNHLHRVKINIHEIQSQKKVADILSTYDDLIENNNCRITILEKIAQEVYKEWFVRMRFPNHKTTQFYNGIPDEWEVVKLGEIATNIFSGGTPNTRKPEYWNGDYYWLSSGETRNRRIYRTYKTISKMGIQNSSTSLAKQNDLVMASAGQGKTRGQLSLIMADMYINQSLIAIRFKDKSLFPYVFANLKSRYDELRSLSDASSIRGSITTELLKSLNILVPKKEIVKQYYDLVSPFTKELAVLETKNYNLIKQRDLLLPRLMSGKLEVK